MHACVELIMYGIRCPLYPVEISFYPGVTFTAYACVHGFTGACDRHFWRLQQVPYVDAVTRPCRLFSVHEGSHKSLQQGNGCAPSSSDRNLRRCRDRFAVLRQTGVFLSMYYVEFLTFTTISTTCASYNRASHTQACLYSSFSWLKSLIQQTSGQANASE